MKGQCQVSPAPVTSLWQINTRYKYDPDPNNKTRLICQKVSFQFWNLPLYFVLDLNPSKDPSIYHGEYKTICHILLNQDQVFRILWHPDSVYFSKFSVHQSRQDSGENYNFVTSEAKRNFLRSQPSSPCRSGHAISSGGELSWTGRWKKWPDEIKI